MYLSLYDSDGWLWSNVCVRMSESAAGVLGLATATLPDSPVVPEGHRSWLPLRLPPIGEEEQSSSLGTTSPQGPPDPQFWGRAQLPLLLGPTAGPAQTGAVVRGPASPAGPPQGQRQHRSGHARP